MSDTVFYIDEEMAVEGSSNLYQVWYDAKLGNLFVEFHNGTIAGYEGVSGGTWGEFRRYIVTTGLSAGQYYNRMIRGKYRGINTDDIEFINRPKVPTSRFTVSGTTLVSLDLEATNMDEAIKAFIAAYPHAVIKEATVKFG